MTPSIHIAKDRLHNAIARLEEHTRKLLHENALLKQAEVNHKLAEEDAIAKYEALVILEKRVQELTDENGQLKALLESETAKAKQLKGEVDSIKHLVHEAIFDVERALTPQSTTTTTASHFPSNIPQHEDA